VLAPGAADRRLRDSLPAHIGDGFDRGTGALGSLLIQAAGQPGEALGLEDLAYGGGAQEEVFGLERCADFIDRVVLLAQGDDEGMGGGLFGLNPGAGVGGEEEGGLRVVAEAGAQDAEGGWGVAEGAGDLLEGRPSRK
jgi:hypothetical protein